MSSSPVKFNLSEAHFFESSAAAGTVPEGTSIPPPSQWRLSDFEIRPTIIGQGALGKVYLSRLKHYNTSPFFAVKIMKKAELVRLRQAERVVREAGVHAQVTAAPKQAQQQQHQEEHQESQTREDEQHQHDDAGDKHEDKTQQEQEGGEEEKQQQEDNTSDIHRNSLGSAFGSFSGSLTNTLATASPAAAAAATAALLEQQQKQQRQQDLARAASGRKFIVSLHRAFADHDHVYFVLDHASGGELFARLRKSNRFPVDVARFYIAELIMAIDYLHTCERVVHRSLEPENLLLDGDGHLKLGDFGNAKTLRPTVGANGETIYRTYSICGVPEYVAPEVAAPAVSPTASPTAAVANEDGGSSGGDQQQQHRLFQGHSFAVDWWSVGVILFEMLCGFPPFVDEAPHKVFEKAQEARRDTIPFPAFLTDAKAKDLIAGLLTPDPAKRLGSLKRGVLDICKHRFFAGMDWNAMRNKQVAPPDFVRQALQPVVVHPAMARRAQKILAQPEMTAALLEAAQLAADNDDLDSEYEDDKEGNDAKRRARTAKIEAEINAAALGNNNNANNSSSAFTGESSSVKLEGSSVVVDNNGNASGDMSMRSPNKSPVVGDVTAVMLEMQLGLPYDKYPVEAGEKTNNAAGSMEALLSGSSTTAGGFASAIEGNNAKALAAATSSRGGGGAKPLTEAQQAIFSVFSE